MSQVAEGICKFDRFLEVDIQLTSTRFAIGYIYSFIAARVFYWALMRFFQHEESRLDHANTGEDIIAALDERQLASDARKPQKTMREWARSMLHKRKNRSSV